MSRENLPAEPGVRQNFSDPWKKEETGGGRKKEAEKGKGEGGGNGEAEMRSIEAMQRPSFLENPKE